MRQRERDGGVGLAVRAKTVRERLDRVGERGVREPRRAARDRERVGSGAAKCAKRAAIDEWLTSDPSYIFAITEGQDPGTIAFAGSPTRLLEELHGAGVDVVQAAHELDAAVVDETGEHGALLADAA